MRTVRRGYLVDRAFHTTRRVIVDSYGLVFFHGCGGWARPVEGQRLVLFPVEQPYEQLWDGWWEKLWAHPVWGWLYMARNGVLGSKGVLS